MGLASLGVSGALRLPGGTGLLAPFPEAAKGKLRRGGDGGAGKRARLLMAGAGGDRSPPPVRLALGSLREAPHDRLHLLPCEVQHDGGAPVQRYFSPAIRGPQETQSEAADESTVSFRGRSLKGKQVLVPEGYMGLVLEEDMAPYLSSEERNVQVKSTFESMTVWNLERAPNESDEIFMAFGWPKIAEGIHAPVADEE